MTVRWQRQYFIFKFYFFLISQVLSSQLKSQLLSKTVSIEDPTKLLKNHPCDCVAVNSSHVPFPHTVPFPLKCVFSNPGRKVSPNHIVSCKNCFSTVNDIVSSWENLITTYALIRIYLIQEGFVFVGTYVCTDIYNLQSRKRCQKRIFHWAFKLIQPFKITLSLF